MLMCRSAVSPFPRVKQYWRWRPANTTGDVDAQRRPHRRVRAWPGQPKARETYARPPVCCVRSLAGVGRHGPIALERAIPDSPASAMAPLPPVSTGASLVPGAGRIGFAGTAERCERQDRTGNHSIEVHCLPAGSLYDPRLHPSQPRPDKTTPKTAEDNQSIKFCKEPVACRSGLGYCCPPTGAY